jgi:hypothetical protein
MNIHKKEQYARSNERLRRQHFIKFNIATSLLYSSIFMLMGVPMGHEGFLLPPPSPSLMHAIIREFVIQDGIDN